MKATLNLHGAMMYGTGMGRQTFRCVVRVQWAGPTGVRAFRRIPKTGRIHAWSTDSVLDAADSTTTKGP